MVSFSVSCALSGMECRIIRVETDVSNGLPSFEMVGMLNSEVKEAKERVKVALKNNGYSIPPMRITVNLSPANIRKNGTKFDLPIAISLLIALGEINQDAIKDTLIIGELGLNGELRFVNGVLPITIKARESGFKRIILPVCNSNEAASIEGIDVYGFEKLRDVLDFIKTFNDNSEIKCLFEPVHVNVNEMFTEKKNNYSLDFSEVIGQEELKKSCLIAAAGFHHMLIVGPPGCGKSMVAKRMPTILPPLSYEESLEVSKIYSIAGYIGEYDSLVTERPYNSPHHTITEQAMSGGGLNPKPGIISLSHRGVLFLDEAVHFDRRALELLRQPLEDKKITICRSSGKYEYPSDFMLIAAINPCPCGFYPDRNRCRCNENQIKNYLGKISGPIIDRIDLCVQTKKLEFKNLKDKETGESSESMREKVMKARDIQLNRFKGSSIRFNSEMSVSDIERFCVLKPEDEVFFEKAFRNMQLSARSYHKVLRVARTIADLDDSEMIERKHLAQALNYRLNELFM